MYWLILAFHIAIMLVAATHALVYKRDHRAALGWIGFIVLFPILGPLIYFLFGINRLRSKAQLFAGKHLPFMHFGYERATRLPVDHYDSNVETLPEPHLAEVGGRVTNAALIPGNAIKMLHNGEAFFPRLIAAIDDARQTVLLSSYLFSRHGVGGEVVAALTRAAARNVAVKVLVDGVGAWYSLRRVLRPLRKGGVEVALFLPPSLIPPSVGINLRNHRKIAVVDGRLGFFGGINIDQRHMVEDPTNPHPTQDVQFEVAGPMVEALQTVFAADWWLATRAKLQLVSPPLEAAGGVTCRVIDDGPDESLDYLAMTLMGVFAAARYDITIMMPYFLPSRELIAALQAATLRGVRVRVILPEKSNLRMVDWATRNMLWELLIWHVEVYFKPAPFAHTKLITVDRHYVLGGSANLDARSLRLNFELGVEMFDGALAEQVQRHIEAVVGESRRVQLEEVDKRPGWQRVRDAVCWLFSSYL